MSLNEQCAERLENVSKKLRVRFVELYETNVLNWNTGKLSTLKRYVEEAAQVRRTNEIPVIK